MSRMFTDGAELCEVLGLNPKLTRSITLRFAVGQVSTVVVEQIVTVDEAEGLKTILRTFELFETTEEEDTP